MIQRTLALAAFAFVVGIATHAGAQAPAVPTDALTVVWPGSLQLGVLLISVTPELRTHFGSADGLGVLVGRVEPGSLASSAGVQVGDLIVRVDGTGVHSPGGVRAIVQAKTEGQTLTINVLRAKRPVRLTVVIPASTGNKPSTRFRYRWPTDLLDPWHQRSIPPEPWGTDEDPLEQRLRELERRLREMERRLDDSRG